MQSNPKVLHFFLGSSTPQGFVSRFDQLGDPDADWRLYVIKGGPGSGKSTLMRRLASELSPLCGQVEMIHCSSDVASLDGVIFSDHKISIADGTPPHVIEPKYPGAYENIVPVFDCWDRKALYERRKEIMQATKAVKHCHEYCARFLTAAGSLLADTYRIALEATDTAKVARYAASFAAREFKKLPQAAPTEAVRFLSAITDKGPYFFSQTAQELCKHIYLIDDDYGAASRLLLMALRSHAMEAGYSVITCYCPLAPFEKIDHLFIPQLDLGIMTVNRFHSVETKGERTIHARRFTDAEQIKQRKKRISFNLKGAAQMIDHASSLLAEAKAKHDLLEALYIGAMDFGKLEALSKKMAEELHADMAEE